MIRNIFVIIIFCISCCNIYAENSAFSVYYEILPLYKYTTDKQPARVLKAHIKGRELKGEAAFSITLKGNKEQSFHSLNSKDSTEIELLLPAGSIKERMNATICLTIGNWKNRQTIKVDPMRYWNVYIYNHSHVDIGYTNTHKNVEMLHKNNVLEGIKLAEETSDFITGANYVWNPEVTWPIERLWMTDPQKRSSVISAMKKKQLCVDASYVNLNTSTCSDEELFHIFRFSRELQKLSGQPIDVFQQFDIPGISWGLIPVMAQEGIKYIISWPNSDRAGNAHSNDIDGKPFWWLGPDGKSKVLFFQPGGYANSGSMGKGGETGRPWFGQRDPEKVPLRINTGAANVNFVNKLIDLEKANYPYDFILLSWSLWDNSPIDADVPFAVKQWNETYAYPKLIITGGHEVMTMIEEKYGNQLPVVKGDYTEYWTDGLGTAAALTAINRNSKERLIQAETVWSMLADGKKAPREEFDEAWRYILLGSEHTWCFENPTEPFFQDAIWKIKQSYFHQAQDRSIDMLDASLAPITDKSNGALGPKEGPANGGISVINTQTWEHSGLVTLSKSESLIGDRVVDSEGKDVLSQRLSTGELVFFAEKVPALGTRHYRVMKGDANKNGHCKLDGMMMENDYLQLKIDSVSGNILTLHKKGIDYNYVDVKVDNGLNSFSWLPANVNSPITDSVTSISTIENGPLIIEVKVDSKAKGCRSVSRSVRLVSGLPWVEIKNVVDKLPLIEKDGIHFGFAFDIPDSKTRVDIPWGIMEIEKDQWPQANRNWMAVQRWIDISNDSRGVTWCSLDAPLFEYGDRSANISLGWGGKGPWLKTLDSKSNIYSWVMNNHWHTNFPLYQDGPTTFRYRLYPHMEYDVVEVNRFGVEQFQPLVRVSTDKDPMLQPLLKIDNPKVYVTILKPLDKEKEIIVRLRSLSDKEEDVYLQFPNRKPKEVNICHVEEFPEEKIDGQLRIDPFGQKTLLVRF